MSTTLLNKARAVSRPTRQAMLQRDPSVHHFWNENEKIFEQAWMEWEMAGGDNNITLDKTLYSPKLRRAIEQSWKDPTKEMSCLLYTSPSPRDGLLSRMPSSA